MYLISEDAMQSKFYPNGFLVKEQLKQYQNYVGVEGGCWPLNLDDQRLGKAERIYFSDFINSKIELSWKNPEYVDVASEWDFVKQYSQECKQKQIQPIILFCETTRLYPQCVPSANTMERFEFIGFDYAFSGGSYYSAVFSDVFTRRIKEFFCFELNEFGLFSKEEEITKFIEARSSLRDVPQSRLEQGDFIIYKLWKYSENC
jgi:hypothetical protein